MTMQRLARFVQDYLKTVGKGKVLYATDWSDIEDGAICLTNDFHIQIGIGYSCLVQKVGEGFKWVKELDGSRKYHIIQLLNFYVEAI